MNVFRIVKKCKDNERRGGGGGKKLEKGVSVHLVRVCVFSPLFFGGGQASSLSHLIREHWKLVKCWVRGRLFFFFSLFFFSCWLFFKMCRELLQNGRKNKLNQS